MKVSVQITVGDYGFAHNWALVCETPKQRRVFWLGQDVKFCNRVLGMSPRAVVNAIGDAEISEGREGNTKLAKFIVKELGIDGRKLSKYENWEFSAQ